MSEDMSYDLKKMADMEKSDIETSTESSVDPDTLTPLGAPLGVESLGGVGAPVIILPGSEPTAPVPTEPALPTLLESSDVMSGPASSDITDEDLRAVMPDLDDASFMNLAKDMKLNLSKYQKNLVINNGFTPEEAIHATRKKMEKDGRERNSLWLEENPKVGVVEINKTQENSVSFTLEEKEKLSKVKNIRLVVCEDMDLKSIPIKKMTRESKIQVLKTTDFNLSKYSIPLPVYGDFVTFKGAQIIQLAATTNYDESKLDEEIERKAALLYDCLIGGLIMLKFGEKDGRKVTNMGYNEFLSSYPYFDLDMGMFGVLCASSSEESHTTLTCNSCGTAFDWTYNTKALLNMDAVSDKYKGIIDRVLGNKSDWDVLMEIHSNNTKSVRYKSPFSNHIYDISHPSLADALRIYRTVNQEDQTAMSIAQVALFIRSMFLYSAEDEAYIPINNDPTLDETQLLIDNLLTIPQNDINLISKVIADILYIPQFILHSKCPACGKEMTNILKVDEMIFLGAQDSFTEMRL